MNKVYLTSRGNGGISILYLHGLWGGGNYFRSLKLLDGDFTEYFPDELGFGKSPKPRVNYTPALHIEKIKESLPNKKFIVIGNSYGALLALHFAKHYPELVSKLILISPVIHKNRGEAERLLSTKFIPRITISYPLLAHALCLVSCKYGMVRLASPFIFRNHKRIFKNGSRDHTWWSYSSTFKEGFLKNPIFDDFESIADKIPTFILYGEKDTYINPETFESLTGNKLVKKELKSASHNVLFEEFDVCKKMLREFVG